MYSSKDTAKYVIVESLKTITKLHKKESQDYYARLPIKEDMVMKMINDCGHAMSQDGFEVCLLTHREDLIPLFIYEGECPEFEEFLNILDEMVGDIKETMAEKHLSLGRIKRLKR
jgi:hypothetical protein